jgi:hypothetical protein
MSRRPQIPLVCHGHSRPIVEIGYSGITEDGYFLMSASKGTWPPLMWSETTSLLSVAVETLHDRPRFTHALCGRPPQMASL